MLISRIKQIMDSRGVVGLMRFIVSRLIRVTTENVYQNSEETINHSKIPTQYELHVIRNMNLQESKNTKILNSIYRGEIKEYIDALKNNSILFLFSDNNKVIHTSFVQFGTRYKRLIGEKNNTPLIGNCWTASEYRGQGLYPEAINTATKWLFKNGYKKVIITCDSNNIASIKGIERANFLFSKNIKSYIFINKFAIQIYTKENTTKMKVVIF